VLVSQNIEVGWFSLSSRTTDQLELRLHPKSGAQKDTAIRH